MGGTGSFSLYVDKKRENWNVSYKDVYRNKRICMIITMVNSARYDSMMLGEKSADYFHTSTKS